MSKYIPTTTEISIKLIDLIKYSIKYWMKLCSQEIPYKYIFLHLSIKLKINMLWYSLTHLNLANK